MVGRLLHLSSKEAGQRADELLERLDLTDASTRLVKTFSGGMRRRLDLAASLVARPSVLFLDEPTTGLDPRSRSDLWDMLRDLVLLGTTIILTTQYLEEADQLARQIVIVDRGHVIDAGTPDELKDRAGRDVIVVRPRSAGDLAAIEQILATVSPETPQSDMDTQRASVGVDEGTDQLATVVRLLDERHIALDDIGLRRPSLDEVFLTLTGESLATGDSDGDSDRDGDGERDRDPQPASDAA
jgi:ABC-2 type transport system ATP-binding protein